MKKTIKILMAQHDMSAHDVAKKAGLNRRQIYSGVNESKSIAFFKKLAGAFDMKASELIALAETEETANK